MTKEEILEQIQQIVRQVLQRDDILLTESTTAHDVEGWDSLTNMKIVVRIEEVFQCRFNFRDILKFKNIGDLCQGILCKI